MPTDPWDQFKESTPSEWDDFKQRQEDFGSIGDRFLRGAVRTAVPSAASIGEILKAAIEPPFEALDEQGNISPHLSGGPRLIKNYLSGIAKGSLGQLEKAWATPSMMGKLGHTAAGLVPAVGPALADEVERAQASGDYAGGIGGALGILGPMAIGARTPSTMSGLSSAERGIAGWAESTAGENMARAVSAPKGYVGDVIENARKLNEELPLGGTKRMHEAVKGEGGLARGTIDKKSLLGKAERTLKVVKHKGRNQPIDAIEIAQEVRGTPQRIPPAAEGAPVAAPEATRGGQAYLDSIDAEASRLEQLAESHGQVIKGQVTTDSAGKSRTKVADIILPGDVPASEMFTVRTQANKAAGAAHQDRPLITPSANEEASKVVGAVTSKFLKAAVPGLEKADLHYSSLRGAGDFLTNALQAETKSGASVTRAVGEVAGRTGLGAAAGFAMGGPSGAAFGAGGVGGIVIARAVWKSPWFQRLSAATKYKVADQLRTGTFTGLGTKAFAIGPEASRQLDRNRGY